MPSSQKLQMDQSQTVHECSLDGPLQTVFCSDMKFKMAATARHSLTLDPMGKNFMPSSQKPNMIESQTMNVHWMVLYRQDLV